MSCFFVGFRFLQAQCSLGIFSYTLVGVNLFTFRINGGGIVLHFQRLETFLPWLFFLCDRYHCLDSAMWNGQIFCYGCAVIALRVIYSVKLFA